MCKGNAARELFGIEPRMSVLSVGFRDVGELRELAAAVGREGRVAGIDIDSTRVELARVVLDGAFGIDVCVGSILDIPFDDRAFDVVICKGILHEVRPVGRAICEAARVVRSSGRIVVVDVGRFPWRCFVRYRLGSLVKGIGNSDVRPGFTRRHLLHLVARSPVREVEYRVLDSKWTLGPCRAMAFLWVLAPGPLCSRDER